MPGDRRSFPAPRGPGTAGPLPKVPSGPIALPAFSALAMLVDPKYSHWPGCRHFPDRFLGRPCPPDRAHPPVHRRLSFPGLGTEQRGPGRRRPILPVAAGQRHAEHGRLRGWRSPGPGRHRPHGARRAACHALRQPRGTGQPGCQGDPRGAKRCSTSNCTKGN